MTKKFHSPSVHPAPAVSEHAIREHAFHLYENSGCATGRDEVNWLAAEEALQTNRIATAADPITAALRGGPATSHLNAVGGFGAGVRDVAAHSTGRRHV